MTYKTITENDLQFFAAFLQPHQVLLDEESMQLFSKDYTEDLSFAPALILLPTTTAEVSAIIKHCHDQRIPVTPRGAGTGLSGGALPVMGGIVLGMQKMNAIVSIDEQNMQAIVEPGVINETLQTEVKEKGLFYPPDPASKGSCMLGGNVAHASGGPRALKYGTTRDYILNLEVVLPTGEIIWTGANTLKYSTGYNLTHLMIGAEGTLGIVTKIVVKLIPYPAYNQLLLASYESASAACACVSQLFMAGCSPSVCEFVEPAAFALSSSYTNSNFEIKENIGAYLLIECDGFNNEDVEAQIEKVYAVLEQNNVSDVLYADSDAQKEYLWRLRRSIGESTKHNNIYKEEDTVVPRATLPELFEGVKKIASLYELRTICYGHAGDGNLHVNILKDSHSDEYWNTTVKKAIVEIFTLCKKLGGTISGEHGIGLVQKEYMPVVLQEKNLELMRGIKNIFDPNNILNPGKIF